MFSSESLVYGDGDGDDDGDGGGRGNTPRLVHGHQHRQSLPNFDGHQGQHSHRVKPFVVRNGRTYLADPSLPYPLPVDLAELHRQALQTLLCFQLFGGPVCSPVFANNPPARVLELGCGTGFWSQMCHQYYARQGYRDVSFTGLDVEAIGLGASSVISKTRSSYTTFPASSDKEKGKEQNLHRGHDQDHDRDRDQEAKRDMNWRFVQHDIRRTPWPLADDEFDLIMIKDLSLVASSDLLQSITDECIRVLQPGGTIERWDSDHIIRMLRPHVPELHTVFAASSAEADAIDSTISAGAYVLTPKTPISAACNPFVVEYNTWVVKAFEARSLPFAPCALSAAMFFQETETLTNASSRRLAVPLSEMRWEREGVGGVVTKDGKATNKGKGKGKDKGKAASTTFRPGTRPVPKAMGGLRALSTGPGSGPGSESEHSSRQTITAAQSALRRTALLTVVLMIQHLEPILREVNGKSQDEWDSWVSKMMRNLMQDDGLSWGECLEIGAWWAQKR